MLQSFVGTVGTKGLITIRYDGVHPSSPNTWPSANVWAVLDTSVLPEISIALRHDQPKRAWQLLYDNAISIGRLGREN